MSIRRYARDSHAPPGVATVVTVPAVRPAGQGGAGLAGEDITVRAGWAEGKSPARPQGLVLSAKTLREVPSTLAGLDNAVVSPTPDDVLAAARAFGPSSWRTLAEDSPLARLIVTPGALILTRTSSRQMVRTGELVLAARIATANAAALFLADDPDWHPRKLTDREVTGWSAKSRVNMVRTLASLDWGPVHALADAGRVMAMVTLTYPGAWETVAPDGKTVKAHVHKLLTRYQRAWGEPVVGAWKLEFQHRGAPHFHIMMAPPHGMPLVLQGRAARGCNKSGGMSFRTWLSATWADIVNHPDPAEYQKHLAAGTGVDYKTAMKCSDPKRLAVYFGKHGQWATKEYQHIVPELWREPGKGPGRFWGYWGLKPLAVAAELTDSDRALAARILRRHAERVRIWDDSASRWTYTRAMASGKATVRDVDPVTGEVIWRKRRRRARVRRFTSGAGFLVVNDAPRLAHDLARAIQVCGDRS